MRIEREGRVEPQHLAHLFADVGLEQLLRRRSAPGPTDAAGQVRPRRACPGFGFLVARDLREEKRRIGCRPGMHSESGPVHGHHAGLERGLPQQVLQGGEAVPRLKSCRCRGP